MRKNSIAAYHDATVNFHDGKLSVKVEIMGHVNKITRLWKRVHKIPGYRQKEEILRFTI